ncbi:hypothetical protein A3715_11705 [Oleiphilus sp. HI0009]|nr:hypothetical protein A3715_11705 [Oleiphilus sp. HI0009]KZZ59990.1 hypothetical protein A3762_03865 [Oleiphilus sp. HI0125]
MTTDTLILVKLHRVLHAIAHNDKASAFHCLIEMVEAIFPCDAAVLLSGSADKLEIAAQKSLREESAQTTFFVQDHPRLDTILQGKDWVRFDANSPLPDPYDNLVDSIEGALPVHDCMGTPLFNIDGSRWGILTFDTLVPHAFNDLDPNLLKVVTELASLCLSIEISIDTLSKIQETNINPSPRIIDNSTGMVNLQNNISAIATTGLNVLIQGESGTGKELIAQ